MNNEEHTIVAALINALRVIFWAIDDSESTDDGILLRQEEVAKIISAWEAFEMLPDDKPGCVLTSPAAKAEWALEKASATA